MTVTERVTVFEEGPSAEEREERLVEGAEGLEASRRHRVVGHPQFLLVVAATLMTVGLSVILLGWYGAAESTLLEEQVPYLISGGLLGVALSFIGVISLLAHWVTTLVREVRTQEQARRADHEQLLEALESIARVLEQGEVKASGRARGKSAQRPVRRTARGS